MAKYSASPRRSSSRGRALVARFDALPELALVVAAGEGRGVLLRLVLEDRLDLEPQLFLRQRHEPRGFVDRPLLPRAAIEPDFRACGNDSSASARSIASLHMRCVPCGSDRSPATKIMSGLNLLEQRAHDLHVRRPDRILVHLAGLVERQVEEARGAPRQADGLDARSPLPLSRMIRLMSCTSGMSTSPGDAFASRKSCTVVGERVDAFRDRSDPSAARRSRKST